MKINESIAGFLDALGVELTRLLSANGTEQVTVSWERSQPDSEEADLVWWSCSLSVDPACRIAAGADRTAWGEIDGAGAADSRFDDPREGCFTILAQAIEQAAKARFGALVSCADLEILEQSPGAWAKVQVAIDRGGTGPVTVYLLLSPDLAVALGGEDQATGAAPEISARNAPPAASPLEILKHVEIPVSVSFGRAQMLLKDLLRLGNGSVVALDRELGDEVEVRVNNCVIARGEVVSVDGNYGVRILEMASSPVGEGVRGALRAE
jgi:flagellar motor switch protein FliN/FliY